jgi:probable rRNA maturation factor
MANKIAVIGLEKRFEKFEKIIGKSAQEILKILKKKNIAAEIYLADNKLMRRLNREYRGKDKTANVLSFQEPEGFVYPTTKHKRIGEIYFNLTSNSLIATRNSRKLSTIGYKLLVHGILHLLGYTHKAENDRIKMEKRENHVLNFTGHRNIAN